MYRHILISFFFLLLAACSPEETSGPGEVRWDRETCTRCNMAIGDHQYAAQIRGGAAGEKSKLYKFDDIGCAVLWLSDQPWKDSQDTEIWVIDQQTGNWIDARKASYIKGKISPMNYGLGAQAEATENSLDYSQATAHIIKLEKGLHQHGGHNPMNHK
ncbi:MAG: nitrous oxide reductase accessory protein NosL [Pseudomonadota bacterium]|nr:nitrous oxide reductase accessory protein NosL [Pseudomonadota bacterium]